MSYVIHILFRSGNSGYYACHDRSSISFKGDSREAKTFPTFSIALSHAKWLRREYSDIVGRTDVLRLRS